MGIKNTKLSYKFWFSLTNPLPTLIVISTLYLFRLISLNLCKFIKMLSLLLIGFKSSNIKIYCTS